jgi:hypothetical protein
MRRLATPTLAALALALSSLPVAAEPRSAATLAGPPWISIESPANPYNSETKGALLVVRVYHHGDAAFYPLTGTAEGMVNGKRESLKLDFTGTSTPGMYALKFQEPSDGNWILVISVGGKDRDQHGSASAIVTLGTDGTVVGVQVPTRQEGQWLMPAAVSEADIDARLKAMGAA